MKTIKATPEVIAAIYKALEGRNDRSAWDKGITIYAVMHVDTLQEIAQYNSAQGLEPPTINEETILNGALSWEEWAYGGCGLVYDCAIAETLCNPSVLKRKRGGALAPDTYGSWLDIEARAARQAWRRVAEIISNLTL